MGEKEKIRFWQEKMRSEDFVWEVTVASTSQGVCWVSLGEHQEEEEALKAWMKRWYPHHVLTRSQEENDPVLSELQEYFQGQRHTFTVPLDLAGTPFQRQVWAELRKIPYGVTLSYSDIAFRINKPKAQRAVGMANHNNPVSVIVPCHRVVGKSGDLTGYAGGIELKERLLRLETSHRVAVSS